MFLAKIDESRTVKRQIFFRFLKFFFLVLIRFFYIRVEGTGFVAFFLFFFHILETAFSSCCMALYRKKNKNELGLFLILVLVKLKKQLGVSSQIFIPFGGKIDLKLGLDLIGL